MIYWICCKYQVQVMRVSEMPYREKTFPILRIACRMNVQNRFMPTIS